MHPLSGTTWYVLYSSRTLWQQKRNVHATTPQPETLLFTYQERGTSEIKSREEKGWEAVASGKVGKLESWMRETEMGIEDGSGEIRADWRSSWIAISFSSTLTPSDNAFSGVDILCSRNEKTSNGMIEQIRCGLVANGGEALKLGKLVMFPVLNDRERDDEVRREVEKKHKEWEKRTGKEAGISPDLTYDEEEKEDSNCEIQ